MVDANMMTQRKRTAAARGCAPEPSGQAQACASGCGSCRALAQAAARTDVAPRDYVLGSIWVFLVPMLGLIAGCVAAGGWDGRPLLQVIAIVAGLATGVAVGVICRKRTMPDPSTHGSVRGAIHE